MNPESFVLNGIPTYGLLGSYTCTTCQFRQILVRAFVSCWCVGDLCMCNLVSRCRKAGCKRIQCPPLVLFVGFHYHTMQLKKLWGIMSQFQCIAAPRDSNLEHLSIFSEAFVFVKNGFKF